MSEHEWKPLGEVSEEKMNRRAVLFLRDGREAHLKDITVQQALALVDIARRDGILISGEIDPADVEAVGWDADTYGPA
jgi:hypothetical protein